MNSSQGVQGRSSTISVKLVFPFWRVCRLDHLLVAGETSFRALGTVCPHYKLDLRPSTSRVMRPPTLDACGSRVQRSGSGTSMSATQKVRRLEKRGRGQVQNCCHNKLHPVGPIEIRRESRYGYFPMVQQVWWVLSNTTQGKVGLRIF